MNLALRWLAEPPVPAPACATRHQTIGERLGSLRHEIAVLEHRLRVELVLQIANLIGGRVVFNARELFAHRLVAPELALVFDELGITSAKQLGKQLKQLGLTRVGEDEHGVLWTL